MTDKDKTALVYRITSGYTFIGDYIIDTPTDKIFNESLQIYQKALRKYRFEDMLLKDDTENVLVYRGLWQRKLNQTLKELDKSLEDCKLELYKAYGMPQTQITQIRHRLDIIRKKQAEYNHTLNSLDRFTTEGLAEYVAELYLFSKLVLNKDYRPISVNTSVLEGLIAKYKLLSINTKTMRLLARTEPWRSFWHTNPNCFRVLGDEQKVLVMFSKMYDNVYEHSERPVEGIINDDDMLDGWFISMHRKAEEERRNSTKNLLAEKYPRAQEIFITANTPEQVAEIEALNDARAKIVKKKINEGIQQKGLVRDQDIDILRIGS